MSASRQLHAEAVVSSCLLTKIDENYTINVRVFFCQNA